MTEAKSQEFVIVQATDLLPDGDTTLEHGVALARTTGGRLVTLHVSKKDPSEPMPDVKKMLEKWSPEGLDVDHYSVVYENDGKIKKGLLKSLKEIGGDLLVMGTRRQSVEAGDSISEMVALEAQMPTLVVHVGQQGLVAENGALQLRRVLLPVGEGAEAREAIRGLTGLLDRVGAEDIDIFLLRVGVDGDILNHLTLPERKGWRWHREVREGFVSEVIGDMCGEKDVDLVVMSTRGRDGVIDVFSGTHTQKVIRRVSCPLLAIPME